MVTGNQPTNSKSAYKAHKQRQTAVLSHRQAIPEHMAQEGRSREPAQPSMVWHSQKHWVSLQKSDVA